MHLRHGRGRQCRGEGAGGGVRFGGGALLNTGGGGNPGGANAGGGGSSFFISGSFPYLIGKRPSSSDFALFGQFSQLVNFDPTPREIVHEVSMRTVAWVGVIEDLSGLEVSDDDWFKYEDIPSTIKELLTEIGKGYVPALLANAKAIENEEKEWETEIDGCIWRQKSFPYQAKCLKWINEEYNMLSKIDMEKVDNLLDGTGCEKILNII